MIDRSATHNVEDKALLAVDWNRHTVAIAPQTETTSPRGGLVFSNSELRILLRLLELKVADGESIKDSSENFTRLHIILKAMNQWMEARGL